MKKTTLLAALLVFASVQVNAQTPTISDSAAVYATALNRLFPVAPGGTAKQLVIREKTRGDAKLFPANLRQRFPTLDSTVAIAWGVTGSTITDLRSALIDSIKVRSLNGVRIVKDSVIDAIFRPQGDPARVPLNEAWVRFHTAWPGSGGYVTLSVVVFSQDGKSAAVSVAHSCGGLCGSGKIAVLVKINGTWTYLGDTMLWIS